MTRTVTSFRLALLVLAILWVGTVAAVLRKERARRQAFAGYQRDHAALLGSAGGAAGAAAGVRRLEAAGRVDRCPTCHMAIPGGTPPGDPRKDLKNPHRPHPGRWLVNHPPGRFACTTCHGAGGEYLDRCLPSLSRGAGLALAGVRVQASCPTCHGEASGLPGAPALDAGLAAFQRLGCGGWHPARGLPGGRKIGPPLSEAARKLTARALRAFILSPQQERPGSAMPGFFGKGVQAGLPAGPAVRLRQEAPGQADALVAFMESLAPPAPPGEGDGEAEAPGDPGRGKALFERMGCRGCHPPMTPRPTTRPANLETLGPALGRSAGRLRAPWLAQWLTNPGGVFPETRMPDFRLKNSEISDLSAYLLQGGSPAGRAARPGAAVSLVRQGRDLALRLGCPGCHEIRGMERSPAVGPELDRFGASPPDLLDWGLAPGTRATRSAERWTRIKLTRPRAFDRGSGQLLMPWQPLRSGELEGLLVLLRSLTGQRPPAGLQASPAERDRRLRRGERLVQERGCRGCHSVGGRGGSLHALLPRPSDRPPDLNHEGARVLPAWLDSFLRAPTALRPWLAPLRMPTFGLTAAQRADIAAFLAALDRVSYPFVAQTPNRLQGPRLDQAIGLFTRLKCLSCHQLSNAHNLKPGELAPDLALGAGRLRRVWITRFMLQPQDLLPGTRMPTLFPLADEDDPDSRTTPAPDLLEGDISAQAEALSDLSLRWGRP